MPLILAFLSQAVDFRSYYVLIYRMRTRGDALRYSIAYALIRARKVVRGLRQGLTEQDRYDVADAAIYELQKHGDPWRLSEPVRDVTGEGLTTGPSPPKPDGR